MRLPKTNPLETGKFVREAHFFYDVLGWTIVRQHADKGPLDFRVCA